MDNIARIYDSRDGLSPFPSVGLIAQDNAFGQLGNIAIMSRELRGIRWANTLRPRAVIAPSISGLSRRATGN